METLIPIYKTALIIIMGAIPLYALIYVRKKYHTPEYYRQFRIILFIFLSIPIGLIIYDRKTAFAEIPQNFYNILYAKAKLYSLGNFSMFLLAFAILLLAAWAVCEQLKERNIFSKGPGGIVRKFFVCLVLSLFITIGTSHKLIPVFLFNVMTLFLLFTFFGAVHAMLGPLISAVTLALMINHVTSAGFENFNAVLVWGDILEIFSISSRGIGFGIIVTSCIVGSYGVMEAILVKIKDF